MNLKKVLTAECVLPSLVARGKDEAIELMVRHLAKVQGIDAVEDMLAAVRAREAREATGLEHGIAVPHGKTDAVGQLVAGVARLVDGVDFSARDGRPARILVMTISPKAKSGPHLQFLGEVVRILRDEQLREQILSADSAEEIRALVVAASR